MTRNEHRRRRAWTLAEMILLLPLFGLVGAGFVKAFRAQTEAQARFARHAEEEMALASLLAQLRRDVAEAADMIDIPQSDIRPADRPAEEKARLHDETGDPSQSLRIDWTPFSFRVKKPAGDVVYSLLERAPLYDRPIDTIMTAAPPLQTLIRIDADGHERRWHLGGLALKFRLRRGDAGRAGCAAIEVVAASTADVHGGIALRRSLQTTLLAGGCP